LGPSRRSHASRRSLRGERERPEIERRLSTDQFAALDSNHHPALYAARRISASLAAFARRGSGQRAGEQPRRL
jgi:predicted membrane chloride channel (bestrophin family)